MEPSPDVDMSDADRPANTKPESSKEAEGDCTLNNTDAAKPSPGVSCSTCCASCYVPKRFIVTCLLGMGMLLTYAMRTNVGVTVVMILDERIMEKLGTLEAVEQLPKLKWDSQMIGFLQSVFYIGLFIVTARQLIKLTNGMGWEWILPNLNWDSQMIGFLHSVFYIGFLTSQIPGAFFTTVWPANRLYGICILFSALLNLLLPVCIGNGLYALTCVVRSIQGLAEGLLYPTCYAVLRHWSAPTERSRQVSMVLTCAYAGAILGFPLAGLVTHYLGWQYVYYVCGSMCILWYVAWTFLSYEKPSHHKSISDKEYEFMTRAQGQDVIDYENVPVPWKSILTSLPVLAICLCHFARHWVLIFMLTNEPLYLNAFGFNIAETGVYASLPHIAKVVLSLISGHIADALLNAKSLSTTVVRKLLTAIGFGILCISFIVLTFMYSGAAVVAILTYAFGAFGLATSGWSVNHYDLSTRHASSLVAVTSTFGTTGAIIVPLVVGALTPKQTLEGWDNVFYVTAAILAVALIFYLVFGSGDQQPWANPPPSLKLIQKEDPLACKPYKVLTVQSNASILSSVSKSGTKSLLNSAANSQSQLMSQARSSSTFEISASEATDKTELVQAAAGQHGGYGTGVGADLEPAQRLEQQLRKKISGES